MFELLLPPYNFAKFAPDRPLSVLGKGVFYGLLEFEKIMGGSVPEVPKDADITAAQADEIIRNGAASIYPGLRPNAEVTG